MPIGLVGLSRQGCLGGPHTGLHRIPSHCTKVMAEGEEGRRQRPTQSRWQLGPHDLLTLQLSQAEQDFIVKTAFADPDAVRGEC
jgi:hypothetical protein